MPRSGSARRGGPAPARWHGRAAALAPTVEALPLMVWYRGAAPDIALAELAPGLGEEVLHVRNEGRNTDDQPSRRRNARRYRPAPRPVRPRPLPLPARPWRRSRRDDRAGKSTVASCRSASPHGRSCPPPQASRSASEALAVMARSAARRSACRRGFSGSPRDHRYPASACPSAPRRTARSPPAPAERPPACRRRGPPGALAAQQLGGDLAVQRVVLHYQQTHAPQPLGALHRGAAAGWLGRPVRRATHAAPSRPVAGRDRLGEKNRRRAARQVARIGQHPRP